MKHLEALLCTHLSCRKEGKKLFTMCQGLADDLLFKANYKRLRKFYLEKKLLGKFL
jgi:hypothetical protein